MYSATAIFCKIKPLSINYGLKHNDVDINDEGRVITIEYKSYYLIHVYTLNSGQLLARLE